MRVGGMLMRLGISAHLVIEIQNKSRVIVRFDSTESRLFVAPWILKQIQKAL
jgi:hypothetical protein